MKYVLGFLFLVATLHTVGQCENRNKVLYFNNKIFTDSKYDLQLLLGGFALQQPTQSDYIVLKDGRGNLYTFRYQSGIWNEVLVCKTMALPLRRGNILRIFENNKTTLF